MFGLRLSYSYSLASSQGWQIFELDSSQGLAIFTHNYNFIINWIWDQLRMPMFLYEMLFIGWSPLWTVLATRLTRQAGPVIRPDIESWLMLWRTSKNLTTLGWSLNSIWHSSRTCQYAYFPWYVLLTKWWISLWDLSDCVVWRRAAKYYNCLTSLQINWRKFKDNKQELYEGTGRKGGC